MFSSSSGNLNAQLKYPYKVLNLIEAEISLEN